MLMYKTKEVEERTLSELLQKTRQADQRDQRFVDIVRKGDEVRLVRRLQQERNQEKLELTIFKEQELKKEQAAQKEIEQRNIMAEHQQVTDALREEKHKQQLRMSTQEIRDLETQLRACYVGKGLHAQMKEKEVQRIREQMREKAHLEALKIAWKEQEDEDRKKKEEEMRQKYALRLAQQELMIENQKRKMEAYRAFLQEKLLVDAIVQELIEEDRKNAIAKMIRKQIQQEDIKSFIAAQEEWKQRQREELEEENKRIKSFIEMQNNRELENQLQVQRKWEVQAQINDHLSRKLYEEKMRSMEEQQVLQELAEEELHQAHEARIRKELQVAIQKRIDQRLAMVHQQKERILQLQREAQQEHKLRQEMVEERARQDRLEQLTAERRRIKIQEHRQAVERLLKERRLRRNIELEQILRDHEAQVEEEKAREQMIEEERIRLLQEHAKNLLGFMPSGLLRESDLTKLGSNFKQTIIAHGKKYDPCMPDS